MLKFNSRDKNYKTPFGAVPTGQAVHIRFPIESGICTGGVFLVIRSNKGDFNLRKELIKTSIAGGYDTFECDVTYPVAGIYFYRFEVEIGSGIMFVGRDENGFALAGDFLPEWQQTVYFADFHTPNLLKGGVIYHIFPDRFCRVNNNQKPKFGYLKSWNDDITIADADGVYRANDFFGGNIKGIMSKLDYLEKLGITAIYLSPIFESSSNHRYDTADYMKIDSLFGTEDEFAELCVACKKRGIAVILDGVFNHTGADSIYFNKFGHYKSLGAYQSKQSPYYDWYTFNNFPDGYECWWGITVVPTISAKASEFQNFIAGEGGVLEKWTKLGASAWRLDVADELSTTFLEKIRTKLKSLGDTTIIGEVWEDASTKVSYGEKREYLFGDELDGVMNYPFRTAIIDYVLSGDARRFATSVNEIIENYPLEVLNTSMTLLGTHDTARILNALGASRVPKDKEERKNYRLSKEEIELGKKRLMLASAIQFMLPGIPNIYYGDEIGMQGFDDPINRRPMAWDKIDEELLAHYTWLCALRKRNKNSFTAPAKVQTDADGGVIIERPGVVLWASAKNYKFTLKENN